jgi:hypothetical protein
MAHSVIRCDAAICPELGEQQIFGKHRSLMQAAQQNSQM